MASIPSKVKFLSFKRASRLPVREALQTAVAMRKGNAVNLTTSLAIAASKLSLANSLPMADSVIPATAREFGATLWTQDSHFENMRNVTYFAKK